MAKLYGWAIKIKGLDADHTYVTSSDGGVWPCWGRSSGGQKIASGLGSSKQANCISQSSSHAGIIYGITGVCHQTSNRILYPCGKIVDNAKGYWASVLLYGTYGTHSFPALIEWEARKNRCKKVKGDLGAKRKVAVKKLKTMMAKAVSPSAKGIIGYTKKVRKLYVQQTGEVKLKAMSAEKRTKVLAQELDLMADFRLGAKDARKIKPLKKVQAVVQKKKDDFDKALVGMDLTPEDYAKRVNKLMNDLLKESVKLLGKESFVKMFDMPPGASFLIVDPNIIARYHK